MDVPSPETRDVQSQESDTRAHSSESHRVHHIGWLRAAVLGANDGAISTASLVVGVAAAGSDHTAVLLAGLAGLTAGAMAMAAGEYVSVSSQADTEAADLRMEEVELKNHPRAELQELVELYKQRGVSDDVARQVAEQLTAHDALGTHAREELGLSEHQTARPVQAAMASAGSFVCGASVPLLAAFIVPVAYAIYVVVGVTFITLLVLGALAAQVGGAPKHIGALRVAFWGALAMGATALVGKLFGVHVG